MMTTTINRSGNASVRTTGLGTDCSMVVTNPVSIVRAEEILRNGIAQFDLACSRFRPDAEIAWVHENPETWTSVSALLFDALVVALDVAEQTHGAVDPTVATCMESIGYDRDFVAVAPDGPAPSPRPAPGWRCVEIDHRARAVRIPESVRIDLGATAKALAADRMAGEVAALGTGVVVSVGGDLAMAGPSPAGGWPIAVSAESAAADGSPTQVVAMPGGGLASSSTISRTWSRGGVVKHHIVDPRTGDSAPAVWRLVTVASDSCVRANALSTAAVVWGADAPRRLQELGAPARLVGPDGSVVITPGWPS